MQKILFQGDSVTDAGRTGIAEENLGGGYPKLAADMLRQAGDQVTVINRGISGNRAIDLVNRWEEDCIRIRPDVATILIGINDCWRKYDSNDETPVEDYHRRLEWLLKEVREKTEAHIILMEPFVLPYPADRKGWRVTLDPEIHALRELAGTYKTGFVPLDGIMNQAAILYGDEAVCADGVHPTNLGHRIIAEAWLKEYRRITAQNTARK